MDDPRKYSEQDREFEAKRKVRFVESLEPTPESLERALQARVAEVVHRIERGLTVKQEFFRMRTARGQRREIDLLCEDAIGVPVVVEFKRFGQQPREIIAQVVEYMGMINAETGLKCRAFIVVDQAWAAIENAPLVIPQLKILRYAELLPELLRTNATD